MPGSAIGPQDGSSPGVLRLRLNPSVHRPRRWSAWRRTREEIQAPEGMNGSAGARASGTIRADLAGRQTPVGFHAPLNRLETAGQAESPAELQARATAGTPSVKARMAPAA